jgi:hypothetical protein
MNDGQLTGRWEPTTMFPSGKLEISTGQITGVSDGSTVVITLKAPELPVAGLQFSGTVNGPSRHLGGSLAGVSRTFDLSRSTDAAYRTHVAVLTAQSREIIEQLARKLNATRSFNPSCWRELVPVQPGHNIRKRNRSGDRKVRADQSALQGHDRGPLAQGAFTSSVSRDLPHPCLPRRRGGRSGPALLALCPHHRLSANNLDHPHARH